MPLILDIVLVGACSCSVRIYLSRTVIVSILTWLCSAGAGAYVVAKKSVNADRQKRWEEDQRKRQLNASYEAEYRKSLVSNGGAPRNDSSGSPSQEANLDPAPTRHAPESEGQRVREKSKYETSEPFISTKGDRFS